MKPEYRFRTFGKKCKSTVRNGSVTVNYVSENRRMSVSYINFELEETA